MTASENELNQIGEPLRKKEGGLYKAGASKVGDYLEVLLVLLAWRQWKHLRLT